MERILTPAALIMTAIGDHVEKAISRLSTWAQMGLGAPQDEGIASETLTEEARAASLMQRAERRVVRVRRRRGGSRGIVRSGGGELQPLPASGR